MNINPTSSMAPHAGSSTSDPVKDTNNMFLQLLTAQLKAQSPFDPLDPTQFVGQLVQFNSLDQLMQIRQLLQQVTAPAQ